MKRILILTILLMSSLAWAGSTTVVVGQGGGGGITISYKSYTSKTYTGSSFGSIDAPSGTTAGDLLIISIIDDDAYEVTGTGFTQIATVTSSSSRLTILYRVVEEGDGSSYSFTKSGTGHAAIMTRFSKTGGTWDVSTYNTSTASSPENSSTSITSGEVTATAGSCLYLTMGDDDTSGAVTSAPSDMTQIDFLEASSSGQSYAIGAWYQEDMTSGAVQKSVTVTSAGDLSTIAVIIKAEN